MGLAGGIRRAEDLGALVAADPQRPVASFGRASPGHYCGRGSRGGPQKVTALDLRHWILLISVDAQTARRAWFELAL